MKIASGVTSLAGAFMSGRGESKAAAFIAGHRGLLDGIAESFRRTEGRKVVWIHAASLGEFAIARPIIEAMKRRESYDFVITFFSPSGYEVVKKDSLRYPNVYYLPWDSPENVRRFLDTVRPDAAVIMVSEFWHNFLRELKRRSIPVFLVSALIRRESVFFKWYGGDYRKDLASFTRIFTLDDRSVGNLRELGCTCAVKTGDPLFDNAYAIAQQPYHNEVIEKFAAGGRVFIAGSIDSEMDLKLTAALAERNPATKFIVVPHEVSDEEVEKIAGSFKGGAKRCSQCDAATDFGSTQCLIIDFVGALASIYRYGTWAYVGGGFTPLLHSVIEAAVYGLPIAFGPQIHRKVTPRQLMQEGIGTMVTDCRQFTEWFEALRDDEQALAEIRRRSAGYIAQNVGSTETIVKTIEEYL